MGSYDRPPFLTSITRYRQLLHKAELCNGAELLVSGEDWDVLLECVPGASRAIDASTGSLIHKGRLWREKPPSTAPKGVYDLTGDLPVLIRD
jgi:hypothetical protein